LHFDARLSSTIYLVGYQVAIQLGAAAISPLAGMGYDRLGFAATYLILGALVATFTLVSVVTLRADSRGLPEAVPTAPAPGPGEPDPGEPERARTPA